MIRAAMSVAPASVTGVNYVAREARVPRLVALLLDTIFVSVITYVATNVFGVTSVTSGSSIPSAGFATFTTQTTLSWIWSAAIWLGYYAVCEATFSATPGKALNGLTVVSADGRPLTVSSIVIRNLLRLVDVLPGAYLLGGLFVLGSTNSQRIGDLAAHTTVVLRRRVIMTEIMRSSGRRARVALATAVALLVVFTAAFDYFGRPALVVESAYNQHQLFPDNGIWSYSLGTPSRTLDTVSYPVVAENASGKCHGSIDLYWNGLFGWQISGSRLECPPS